MRRPRDTTPCTVTTPRIANVSPPQQEEGDAVTASPVSLARKVDASSQRNSVVFRKEPRGDNSLTSATLEASRGTRVVKSAGQSNNCTKPPNNTPKGIAPRICAELPTQLGKKSHLVSVSELVLDGRHRLLDVSDELLLELGDRRADPAMQQDKEYRRGQHNQKKPWRQQHKNAADRRAPEAPRRCPPTLQYCVAKDIRADGGGTGTNGYSTANAIDGH